MEARWRNEAQREDACIQQRSAAGVNRQLRRVPHAAMRHAI
jgi:hypothetical protein